jgi:hypothetical protein
MEAESLENGKDEWLKIVFTQCPIQIVGGGRREEEKIHNEASLVCRRDGM